MKERPILFSADMVKAILDGRKTQTRRVVKPQPRSGYSVDCVKCGRRKAPSGRSVPAETAAGYCSFECPGYDSEPKADYLFPLESEADFGYGYEPKCPYGQPGDRLWVRETFWQAEGGLGVGVPCLFYEADQRRDGAGCHELTDPHDWLGETGRWGKRPSIFMPRWASRINLEVTSICVERVQEISEEDAEREGCDIGECGSADGSCRDNSCRTPATYREDFVTLWDSINAKRGYGWDKNPWCRCVSFKLIGDIQ